MHHDRPTAHNRRVSDLPSERPVRLVVSDDLSRSRWTVAFRLVLAIPVLIVYEHLRAAPQVAGAAALVLSQSDLYVTDLKAVLLKSLDKLASLKNKVATSGLATASRVPLATAKMKVPQ